MIRHAWKWLELHPGKAGALAGWFQQACSGLATLALIPLILARMSPQDAGLWFSFQGLSTLVGLTDLGIGFVVARQVAFSRAAGENADVKAHGDFLHTAPGWAGIAEVHAATRRIFSQISLGSLVVLAVLYELILPGTALLGARHAELRLAWYLLGGATILLLRTRQDQGFLDGLGKLHLGRLLAGGYQLAVGAATLGALLAGGGLRMMAAGVGVVTLAYLAVVRALFLREAAGRLRNAAPPTGAMVRDLWRVALPMGVVNVSAYLVSAIQVPLIGMVLGPQFVAPFYAAQKMGQMLNAAVMQMVAPQLPLFTSALAAGRSGEALWRMRRIVLLITGLAVFANAGFYFLSPIFAEHIWLGPGHYADRATLLVMAVDYTAMVSSVVWAQFVLAGGTNPFTRTTLIAGVLNLAGCLVLGPRLGALGIALSGLLAGGMTNYWFAPARGLRLLASLRRSAAEPLNPST